LMNSSNRLTPFASGFDSGYKVGFKTGFTKGFAQGEFAGRKFAANALRQSSSLSKMPISTRTGGKKFVDVIISASNEARTINKVIEQVKRIPEIRDVIVVVNGSTDGTEKTARQAGAHVIEFKKLLGYDVGRAIGALHSDADGLLFIDGDIIIDAADLVPFVESLYLGVDLALNDISSLIKPNEMVHSVITGKFFINLAANRPDLGPNTMTAVPHALSRKALNIITPENLAVPPKAQLIAIKANLVVRAVHFVDVLSTNRIRPKIHKGPGIDLVENLIQGDHLEALNYLFGKSIRVFTKPT
jgi:glycosyltransferase involved in cell wall biosynthesis